MGTSLFYSVNGPTDITNGLYVRDLSGSENRLLFSGEGYGALTSYNGKLYAVKGNAVLEYSLENGVNKTSYEISSASSSENRLSAAKDGARAGNLLVTADSGNNRLSIYDMAKGSHTVLPLSYSPSYVATDGEIIAAAENATVYVYARNREGEFVPSFANAVNNTVSGIVCLYGNCYFITHGFGYGRASADFKTEDLCVRDSVEDHFTPSALTADLYGNLYVVRSDGSVFRYPEEAFCDKSAQGERLSYTLPNGFSSVRADFEGNLYCLNDAGVLYKNGEPFASVNGADFVYSETPLTPVSYALGFEDDSVYFNFGNFTVKTNAGVLGFPTLGTIDASGVYEEIARVHSPEEVRYVDVQSGAVGIRVEIETLSADTALFPYDSYSRTAEKYRGVLLAEHGNYSLVALYHDRGYDVRLFRSEQCAEAQPTREEAGFERYLSSDCKLYPYPCVADAGAEGIPRGTSVRVLSVIRADADPNAEPDYGYDFAFVEAESRTREVLRGYVPLSFLSVANPDGKTGETYESARLKLGEETLTFTAEDGSTVELASGEAVRLSKQEDGTYLARYTDESGKVYSANVTEEIIERGESDALRISLIVILSVVALLIVGAYFYLLPGHKKDES